MWVLVFDSFHCMYVLVFNKKLDCQKKEGRTLEEFAGARRYYMISISYYDDRIANVCDIDVISYSKP